MTTVGTTEVETKLAELLDRVGRGEEVVIERDGKLVAKIVAIAEEKVDRRGIYGCLKDQMWIADDFDGPLPPDIQAYFDGEIDDFTDQPIEPDR